MKSLVSVQGYKAWVAGITGDRILLHNAQQWFTDSYTDGYVKQLVKFAKKDRIGNISEQEKEQEKIALAGNRHGNVAYATPEKNLALYEAIIERLGKKTYQGLSSVRSFQKKLQEKLPMFEKLTTFKQIKVLLQLVRFMKCNAECADLTLLEDGAACGKLLISKNITDVDFNIMHQSPCGLVERIQKI